MSEDMPTTELTSEMLSAGSVSVLDLLVAGKLAPSKSEARRLVMQGGVFVSDEKIDNVSAVVDAYKFKGDGIIVRKGKKGFQRFIVK